MNYGKENYYGCVIQNTEINNVENKKFWNQFKDSNNYHFNIITDGISASYGCYYGYNKRGIFGNWSLNYVKEKGLKIISLNDALNKSFIKKIIEIW